MRNFFGTLFGLPIEFNRGFLASKLNSVQLLQFAMMMFFQGNNDLRSLLLAHLVTEGGSGVNEARAAGAHTLFGADVDTPMGIHS